VKKLKGNSQRLWKLKGKEGVALIFVIGIMLLLFIFASTLLFSFKLWEKSCYKTFAGKQAERFAEAGIENGIWELQHDKRDYDSLIDNWRKNFEGSDFDNNGDGIPDSRWIYIYGKDKEIIGRYSVLIEDESGKININVCGNLKNSFNEGFSTFEISILPDIIGEEISKNIVSFRYGKDGLPGRGGFDDNSNNDSLSKDKIDNDGDGKIDEPGEGIDEPYEFYVKKIYWDDRPYFIPEDIKLVNGIGKERYRKIKDFITTFSYDKNTTKEGKIRINLNKADFSQLYSFFKEKGYPEEQAIQISLNIIDYRDSDSIPQIKTVKGKLFIGIDKTPYLNEIDGIKEWEKFKLKSGGVLFTEKGGQFIEIFNPYPEEIDIGGWEIRGPTLLFSNLWGKIFQYSKQIYNDVINGETGIKNKDIIENIFITNVIKIPEGTKIPPFSYYTIGDTVKIGIIMIPNKTPLIIFLPIKDPPNASQYEPILGINKIFPDIIQSLNYFSKIPSSSRLFFCDKSGNIIEIADCPLDTPKTSIQKNDPRVFKWYISLPTPNMQNFIFSPWIGGFKNNNWPSSFKIKNGKFSSLGELSFIHKGRQWESIDFWKDGKDRKIIDYFTVEEDPYKPTYGRLNINTASETVLMCLPLVDKDIARRIIMARPYKDISEILGKYGNGYSEKELLNKEITKYGFDGKDNDFDGFSDCEKEKEMVFSKIINLITVRSNVFKIISTGQKVEDKNGNGKIEKEEILAEKKIVVFYDRDKGKIIYRKQM